MPCITCASWIPPNRVPGNTGKSNMGRCDLDKNLCHAWYHCAKHRSAAAARDTLGLTDDEIQWLRTYSWSPAASTLITLYRMVERCPGDPGARALFEISLKSWRERHTGKETARAREIGSRG